MKTRFSLRTLLVALTLIAIGCGVMSAKIASNRQQEKLLAKALQMAEADGAKVDIYDLDVILPLAGRDVAGASEGGSLSDEAASALVEARFMSSVTVTPIPSAHIKRVFSEGVNRHVVPNDEYAAWERRPAAMDELTNWLTVVVICSAFLALPLLLFFLLVKWCVQLFWRVMPSLDRKLPP